MKEFIQSTVNRIKDNFSLYTISIFPLPTKKGMELLQGILNTYFQDALHNSYEAPNCIIYIDILRSIKIKVFDQIKYEVTVNDSVLSCYNDDLVIFDGSIEGENHEINNYGLANALQCPIEHVLIVSRTYLPLNIYTYKTGGFPSYKKQILSNEDILKWVGNEIRKIKFKNLRDRNTKGYKHIIDYLKHSKSKYDAVKSKETSVFISFRTKYTEIAKNSGYKYSVSELASRIENGYYGVPRSVKYLDNGSLVFNTELLTMWKAWQLLCIIEKEYISYCDEMWIYASDDYLNSWWTMGELILFSYLHYRGIDKRISPKSPKKLKIYFPKEDKTEEIKPIPINEEIAKSIRTIIADCYPQDLNLYFKLSLIAWRQVIFGNDVQYKNGLIEHGKLALKCLAKNLANSGMSNSDIEKQIQLMNESKEFWENLNNHFISLRDNFHNQCLTEEQLTPFLQGAELMQNTSSALGENIDLSNYKECLIEMMSDKFLSEEFWEQIIYNDSLEGNNLIHNVSDILTQDNIIKHLSMDFPGHKVVSNIFEIKEGDVINGKKVVRRPSRFIYMPLLPNEVDPSPTNNNLYEMLVYILE